jgi:hypothetical protein
MASATTCGVSEVGFWVSGFEQPTTLQIRTKRVAAGGVTGYLISSSQKGF